MLNKIKLQNFRRHTELTVDFTTGLNVIRAANEGGKTTIAEAVAYAFGGAKALRDTFAEAVTWGVADTKLKVELDTTFGGEVYTFTRSKGGAEVIKDGQVFVTGQNEVTAFASKMIGADAKLAANLMLANQNSLRGALEQGPKAAAELVEQLSEFDFFDTLLEKMQAKLVLGSDVSARQRLEEAEARLANLAIGRADTSAFEAVISQGPVEIAKLEQQISTTLKPAYEAAGQAYDQAKNSRSVYDQMQNNLGKVQRLLEDSKAQHVAAKAKSVAVDTSAIKGLQAQLDGVVDVVHQRKVYLALEKLNAAYPDAVWDEGVETLQAEVTKTETEIETCEAQLTTHTHQQEALIAENKSLEARIQKDDHCSACNQLLKDHEDIAKRNACLESKIANNMAEIEVLHQAKAPLQAQLADLKEQLADLKGVFVSASPFDNFIRENAAFLNVDTQFVPAKITWKGAAPSDATTDPSVIEQQIADIEAADTASRNAQARVVALEPTIAAYADQVEDLTKQIAAYDVTNVEEFQQAKDAAYGLLATAQGQITVIQREVSEAETQVQLANQAYEQQQVQVAEAEERIAACKAEIDNLAFNNALLKKVRASRGILSDKLWNMVLGAVSTFFTQIRKVHSIVTKGPQGFMVNGQSVQSLSGSALDSLGMALRVALVKTFVPAATFALFDEPTAAADQDRAQSMIGFLQGAGFAQTILITHEEDSAAVADNLITL